MNRRAIGIAMTAALSLAGRPMPTAASTTQTITTTYQYNADGAATAVTTQVDAQVASTSYLTWDNFTPDASTPTSGTLGAGDGNLVSVGSSPGLAAQFAYDVRDRLTACSPSGQSSVSFAYHPASLMASSTLASGDTLQFYYDNTSTPSVVNTRQSSTGMASSFLGPVRYVSDGTEQALLAPRKDTAATYDATAQSLVSYSYDPYGSPLSSSASSGLSSDGTSYDLTQNPFQYATEYQDPTCSAYYLRARWYLPAQQTFLSRDPADPLHRYSYTGGNPVGRSDPSGLKYTGEDFSRDVDKVVHKLSPGAWAYLEPVMPVWGQVMGGIELLGLLPSFWHHPTAEGWVELGFLGASIVSEVGGETKTFDRLLATPSRAFRARLGIDLALGASQTAAQSDRHGRLDVPALIQGIDMTLYGMFWGRAAGGVGYRPYNMTAEDVANSLTEHFHASNDQRLVLVYRVREPLAGGRIKYTSPLLESLHGGWYHEQLLAVGRKWTIVNGLLRDSDEVDASLQRTPWRSVRENLQGLARDQDKTEYAFVGTVRSSTLSTNRLQSNPLGYAMPRGQLAMIAEEQVSDGPVRGFGRASQRHASAVRQGLGL
jgi:RHS repeat-associated protein